MELSSLIFFLYFRKELSELEKEKKSTLKKVLSFSQKKPFSYFRKRNFLIFSQKKAFLIFPEMELSSRKIRNFFIF